MKSLYDTYTLSNGLNIPCLGFGTYNPNGEDNEKLMQTAIEAGYRYFDTASIYGTERALGQAVKKSGLAREEFFIVSKVWMDEMGLPQNHHMRSKIKEHSKKPSSIYWIRL